MSVVHIECAKCLNRTDCAHTGARWLCATCWAKLIDAAWPEKTA